jgi:hypothetical protein
LEASAGSPLSTNSVEALHSKVAVHFRSSTNCARSNVFSGP